MKYFRNSHYKNMKIDGKEIARKELENIKEKYISDTNKSIHIIEVGEHPASKVFIARKKIIAEEIGISVRISHLNYNVTEKDLKEIIIMSPEDGIVLQLPLPLHLDKQKCLDFIPNDKDIDLLRTDSFFSYQQGGTLRMPPVVFAIEKICLATNTDLSSLRTVILGKGLLVGIPAISYFENKDYEYMALDKNIEQEVYIEALKNADLVISGIGSPHTITSDMVKDGVRIIDAGTSEQGGKMVGDIDPSCYEKALWYTPVPGGLGPLTVVGLFANLFIDPVI